MKKYLLLIIAILLMFPSIVLAEEDFTINSIEKLEITGETLEEVDPTINGKNIDYTIRFYNEGDSIKYKLNVTNNTNDKLIIKDNIMSLSNENVKYELEIPDGIASIDKGDSKDLVISISYIKKAKEEDFVGGLYKRNDNIEFTLRNNQLIIGVANTLSNSAIKVVAVALIVLCIVGIIFTKTKANNKITIIFILFAGVALIPHKAEAVKELKFNMIGEIVTELNPCFAEGEMVTGFTYQDSAYTYKFNQNIVITFNNSTWSYDQNWTDNEYDGWGVKLTDLESTEPVESMMCTSINKKKIKAMSATFMSSKTSSIDTSSFNMEEVVITDNMFRNMNNMPYLDMSYKGGPNIESSAFMFYYSYIDEIKMDHYIFGIQGDRPRGYGAFWGMNYTKKIDISYSDMSKVTRYDEMFDSCSSLEEINMSHINIEKLETAMHFCTDCSNLISFDISYAKTDSLKEIPYWFRRCYDLETVNFDGINLENVESMHYFFYECSSLKSIDFSQFKTPKLKSIQSFLGNCTSLEYANISNLGSDALESSYTLFIGDSQLKTVIAEKFNMGTSSFSMFSSCSSLEYIDFNEANFSNISGGFGSFSSGMQSSIKKVDMKKAKLVGNLYYMFSGCTALEEVNMEGVECTQAISMSGMFSGCKQLKTVNFKNATFGNITGMDWMFNECQKLEELDLSGLDLTNVYNFKKCFYNCYKLKSIIFGTTKTEHATNMENIFYNCKSLESLDLSFMDLTNVEYFGDAFYHLDSLTKIDLSNQVVKVSIGLYDIPALTEIVTPKEIINTSIYVNDRWYAKGDTVGVTGFDSTTPTQTIFKKEPWN